jgi:hypothetical protein
MRLRGTGPERFLNRSAVPLSSTRASRILTFDAPGCAVANPPVAEEAQ